MLRGKRRVLLRGQAGSGKTTLVQWLATGAVAGTLGEELAELNHRVPLVLQVRKLARQGNFNPMPEQLVALDGRLCAEQKPIGWVGRVLSGDRGMLLVDGLDEVSEAQRRQILEWLERLLDRYPKVWTLATVRPSAVEPGWLTHLDFQELALSPMGEEHRRRFIGRWHGAILAEVTAGTHTPQELARWRQELTDLESGLMRTLEQSDDLAQITDSPLLCAMVCALNRESDGALPSHRMEIYRDALSMLLVKRDDAKQVTAIEKLKPSESEQLALLRRIAHWLVRNNQVEGERATAIRQIDAALASLPALARQGDAEQVYTHLLNRSGLLAETSTDTFQFIHRTFQDYLAALEFREQGDFGLLTAMAREESWQDVIRMTVGHAPRERAELLRRLIEAGDRAEELGALGSHLTAGQCLPYAQELDGEVRAAVLGRLHGHLSRQPGLLVPGVWRLVGEDLVGVLRQLLAEGVGLDEAQVVRTVGPLGTADALALLGELVTAGVPVVGEVMDQWSNFDHADFVSSVLDHIDPAEEVLQAETSAQLVTLAERRAPRVLITGEGVDLTPITTWPELTELQIGSTGHDLSVIVGTSIRTLHCYSWEPDPGIWQVVGGITRLCVVADQLTLVPSGMSFPQVKELWLLGYVEQLTDIKTFPWLRELTLFPVGPSLDLRKLRHHAELFVHVQAGSDVQIQGREYFEPDRLFVS
ncbi:NACHT domain-containing protein [Kitasatospora gansuensis]